MNKSENESKTKKKKKKFIKIIIIIINRFLLFASISRPIHEHYGWCFALLLATLVDVVSCHQSLSPPHNKQSEKTVKPKKNSKSGCDTSDARQNNNDVDRTTKTLELREDWEEVRAVGRARGDTVPPADDAATAARCSSTHCLHHFCVTPLHQWLHQTQQNKHKHTIKINEKQILIILNNENKKKKSFFSKTKILIKKNCNNTLLWLLQMVYFVDISHTTLTTIVFVVFSLLICVVQWEHKACKVSFARHET